MHAQHNRFNNYHGAKRQLLGNNAGHAAPAWRVNNPAAAGKKAPEQGSKILLSRLPLDVNEDEVEVSSLLPYLLVSIASYGDLMTVPTVSWSLTLNIRYPILILITN